MPANEAGPQISVTTRADGVVYLEFSAITRIVGLTPDQASELGLMLIQQAAISDHVMAAAHALAEAKDQH